ncbi:hypothetical protein TNCV_3797541 [Trichonephila clavipes]|nr:hypothetical protein TNCV_3797541 [Trichonephila clavipes]
MRRTTPELAPPSSSYDTTPTRGLLVTTNLAYSDLLPGRSSVIPGLELAAFQPRIRDHNHSATPSHR